MTSLKSRILGKQSQIPTKYSPTAPSIQAVYRHALDEKVDDWATLSLDQLHEQVDENGVKTYTYPDRRLKS